MAGFFLTRDADNLLRRFDESVVASRVGGWERRTLDDLSLLYTQTTAEWHRKAWFKANVQSDRLAFYIVAAKGADVNWATYGHYHGQLVLTFLMRFRAAFQLAQITPAPTGLDQLR